jgi:hypothetical protein
MTWFLDKQFLADLDLRAYDPAAIAARIAMPVDAVRAFLDPARRYMVKSSPDYGWLAGADRNGKPTLLFVGAPRLASAVVHPLNAVTFDHATGAVTTAAIPLAGDLEWDAVLAAADRAIGFIHVGDAPVLAFKHPEIWHYAVVPLSFDQHATATGDAAPDADDLDLLRDWIDGGNYVLHCGNAYYMSDEGDVESS